MRTKLSLLAAVTLFYFPTCGQAQVIGSYDNFDCFNDTGVEAEGFEIDIEDIAPGDLTREFPSNFSTTPWVSRYGVPTVTSYDFTKATPDAAHSYDAGHKGVLVTWAAKKVGNKWVAAYGSQTYAGSKVAGNGTPYVKNPTYTSGDSCWFYGLGNQYPASGCDHFGVSFAYGVNPGRMTYHWKIPDPTNSVLVNAALEASIPPAPRLTPQPVAAGKPPVIKAVQRAPAEVNQNPAEPQDANPQYGDAYWQKVTTFYAPVDAQLDQLQKANVKAAAQYKTVSWTLLQRPPGVGPNAGKPEREAVENDAIGGKNLQVTKQYEYWKFSGAYDSETHQALCENFYATQAAALAGGNNTVQVSCQNAQGNDAPYAKPYWTIDPGPGTAVYAPKGNQGAYLGAHIAAFNAK